MPAQGLTVNVAKGFTEANGGSLSIRLFSVSGSGPIEGDIPEDFLQLEILGPALSNGGIYEFFDTYSGQSKTFYVEGLYDGEYVITARDQNQNEEVRRVTLTNNYLEDSTDYNAFAVESSVLTKATVKGSATGTAKIVIASVSGEPFKPGLQEIRAHLGDYVDKVFTSIPSRPNDSGEVLFTALKAGRYVAYMRAVDGAGATLFSLEYIFYIEDPVVYGCTDPNATNYDPDATEEDPEGSTCTYGPPPAVRRFIDISPLNSIRMVADKEDALPSMDNRLYCAEDWGDVKKPPYYQKLTRNDRAVIQLRSNFLYHSCQLWPYDTAESPAVATYPVVKRLANRGIEKSYLGWLTADPTNAGFSRLYFNGGELPIAFVGGETVEIKNGLEASLNGKTTIQQVSFDSENSIPFVVIGKPFPVGGLSRVNANVSTEYDRLPYDVYEIAIGWEGVLNGDYYLKLLADDGADETALYTSEPISLRSSHPKTNLFTYRNFDSALGLDFGTGLVCGVRIESDFWQRLPSIQGKLHTLPSGKKIRLSTTAQRKVRLNTFRLPPWLHELIAFACSFDYIAVNGIEYVCEDGYDSPGYSALHSLSNSSALLEQTEAFVDQNGADLGSLTGSTDGFFVINGKFFIVEG